MSDGAITFDRPIRLYTPLGFPLIDELPDLSILSLFLSDHDPRERGQVRYAVYNLASSPNVQDVSSFIRNRGLSGVFVGNWMLVAEWRDVPMFLGDRNEVSE